MKRTLESVAIFVDVQNIYYTTRQCFSRHFDYGGFWAEVTRDRRVAKAIAFAIDRDDEKQRQFQDILRAIGFEVKLKPFIRRSDGSAKGDWDVGITLDVMEYAPQVDVVTLALGVGDFDTGQQDSEAAPSVGRGLQYSSTHGGVSAPGSNKIYPD
jgi:uncharacterized LabA/DUF88 family protein